jgi:hypothetical protein
MRTFNKVVAIAKIQKACLYLFRGTYAISIDSKINHEDFFLIKDYK